VAACTGAGFKNEYVVFKEAYVFTAKTPAIRMDFTRLFHLRFFSKYL
jgi:hypothetical protein